MTNEQAKFILSAYRSSGHDASDPALAEAMRQAEVDPQLREWLAQEKAHSAAISSKLREIVPPSELRSAILAGARISGETRRPRRRFWPVGFAAAACVAGAAAGFALRGGRESAPPVPAPTAITTVSSFAAFAIEDARKGGHGGSRGAIPQDLRAKLGAEAKHLRSDLAFDFEALLQAGCRTVALAQHDVVEVCFSRAGNWYHLYAVRQKDCPDLLEPDAAGCGVVGALGFVTWADAKHQFVLVSSANIDVIRDLVGPTL